MIQVLCRACRKQWHEKYGECPTCGVGRHPLNRALESQRWQTALNEKAAAALREA